MYRPLLHVALAQIRVVADFADFVFVHDEVKAIRFATLVVRHDAIVGFGATKLALDSGAVVADANTIEFPWFARDDHIADDVLVACGFNQSHHHAFVVQLQIK